jgi:hypothetical protein
MLALPLPLTIKQASRLRHYFGRTGRAGPPALDSLDLDLVAQGYIAIIPSDWQTRVEVTPTGVSALHEHRKATLEARSPHHSLGSRLAHYLRETGRITWENVEFRNKVTQELDRVTQEPSPGAYWQCVRPDVFSIKPTLNIANLNPIVHECKVSRADFLSDKANPEKRQAYAAMSEQVYYVTPEGLVGVAELPPEVGLIVEQEPGHFVLIKRAKKHKVSLDSHHLLKMILRPGTFPDASLS